MLVDLLIFNAPYFDSVAAYAGETRDPGRNNPLSIAIVATLVMSTNIVTLIVVLVHRESGLVIRSSTRRSSHAVRRWSATPWRTGENQNVG